jgi:indole-3-glycerol phosphate synthase
VDILKQIFDQKRADLADAKAHVSLATMKGLAADAPQTRGFHKAITESPHQTALIAEVKKASPSKGVIRESFDPRFIAKEYENAGADCLSVLTDAKFFQGSAHDLLTAREATALPVLRKDFTVDEYDVWHARAMSADAVLLIVSGLGKSQLREYRELAEFLGMDALVEAHTAAEAETAIDSGAKLLGINNRDLKTFETNISNTEQLLPNLSGRATLIAESAIASNDDVQRVTKAGARAVLVGSAFCSADDVSAKVKEVMGW